jgi:NTP-dependent ternary system trypsin peptidase co-occuring protein
MIGSTTPAERLQMSRHTALMSIGGVDVLVQTIAGPATERTSALGEAGERVQDAFEKAQDVIVGAAVSTVGLLGKLGRNARPDKLELEFGLGFSVKGQVIVVGGQADATLKVKLTYDAEVEPIE